MPIYAMGSRIKLNHGPDRELQEIGRKAPNKIHWMDRDELADLNARQLKVVSESAAQQPPNIAMLGLVAGLALAHTEKGGVEGTKMQQVASFAIQQITEQA